MPRPLLPHLPLAPCEPQLLELAEAHNAQHPEQRGWFAAGLPWALKELTGCSRAHAHRVVREGMSWEFADRLAIALGLHPANLWGQAWWDLPNGAPE